MLIYRRTSLLESSAQTLVNTVNCVGVMGKGLAHAFKEREPRMFDAYKAICDRKALSPGKLWLWRGANNWVLNFPTKMHWRNPSRLDWIEAGLEKFVAAHKDQGITEVSFPLLGCGNGGLDWDQVRPIMEHYLKSVNIPVYIHDFAVNVGLPEHMESVAQKMEQAVPAEWSFDAFMRAVHTAVDLTGDNMVELGTEKPFHAIIRSDNDLVLESDATSWIFEEEAMRGIWVGLTNGIVTPRIANSMSGGGAASLLSLLSILPQIRPIEIEEADSAKVEVAVELKPYTRRVVDVPDAQPQREFAWH
jgi:O-acetyl-ADP-ribose deacetylase (regulator of RNase III)